MSALIATEECTISHASSSTVSGGEFNITGTYSEKISISGKAILITAVSFSFSGGDCSSSSMVSGSVSGSGSIPATSIKTKSNGESICREGDSVAILFTGTLEAGGTGTVTGNVEISDAGQAVVSAE